VCKVVIGLTAVDETGTHSAYVDGVYQYPSDSKPTIEAFKSGASALVSQFAADQGFITQLDSQIEASKLRDVPVADFEAPEITIDTTVQPAEGSPANPATEEETPAEESSEEEAEESSEEESGGE
tara:strand:- start:1139 stop:1513 length:375 start_codon:yes stop_codon:yes gene_type:complete